MGYDKIKKYGSKNHCPKAFIEQLAPHRAVKVNAGDAGITKKITVRHMKKYRKGRPQRSSIPHVLDVPARNRRFIYYVLFSSLAYLLLEKCTASVNSAFESIRAYS
jgi:hypothetical protein